MEHALLDQTDAPGQGEARRDDSKAEAEAARKPARRRIEVRNLILIGLLLGGSGGYRYWRDHQFATLEVQSRESPFPIKDVATLLGGWRMVDGAETTLDPRIARIAGSTDHVIRTYQNEATGDRVTALVLYGPALLVFGHTPDVCYPSSGYAPLAAPDDVTIAGIDGAPDALFRHALYGRTEGGASQVNEAFHSFRNAGVWVPDMGSRWKQFRYNPGMFKIQIDRVARDSKSRGEDVHDLLAALVADVENRVRAAAAP